METSATRAVATGPRKGRSRLIRFLGTHRGVAIASLVLAGFVLMALLAPFIAGDPAAINPAQRFKGAMPGAPWGTDHLGRDVFARAMFGARHSLLVGFFVAMLTTLIGVALGLYAGLGKMGSGVLMRLNDAMMTIPAVLLAIALASILGAGLWTVIVAITVPEVPRMVRLVRAVTLGVRQEPYVMAAISVGTRGFAMIHRHILPNIAGPVLVQATYVCASAIIASAVLSFLGVGTSPDVPSWGGMMADARARFRLNPELMLYPGMLLSGLVLVVNVLGDRLSDALDPRKARGSDL